MEQFNALTEDYLRENYDPDYFTVENYVSDASKKIKITNAFNRNDDGTVNFDSPYKTQIKKNYIMMPDGKLKSLYGIEKRPDGTAEYGIQDPIDGGGFFSLCLEPDSSFYIKTAGDGKLGGSTSASLYRNKVKIYIATTNVAQNMVRYVTNDTTAETVPIMYKVEKTINDTEEENQLYTFGENTEKDNTYVRISDKTTEIAGYAVPDAITFFAPYQDPAVPLNAYTNIVCVPKEKDGTIVYLPKTDEQYEYDFIAQYAKDFQSLYTK